MVRAVVFDLDGTLIDSRADIADSVNAVLARMGLATLPDALIHGFIGDGAERLIRRALGAEQERYAEAAPIWREEYARRLLDKTRLYDGIDRLLQSPPSARAVLTNKPGGFARQILQGLGVAQAFAAVRGGDEPPRKPAPDSLLQLCALLGAAPSEALMVGDSPIDLATARAAGVPSCAVLWGLGDAAQLAGADYTVDSPQALARLLTLSPSRER